MTDVRPDLETRVRHGIQNLTWGARLRPTHGDVAYRHNEIVDENETMWLIDPHPARWGPPEYDLAYADAMHVAARVPYKAVHQYPGSVNMLLYVALFDLMLLRTWVSEFYFHHDEKRWRSVYRHMSSHNRSLV